MRFLAYAFALLAAAFSLIRLFEWLPIDGDHFSGWVTAFYVLFLFFVLTMAGGALAFIVIAKVIGKSSTQGRPRVSPAVVAVSVALGFLAATPVAGGWDDGCNGHGAVFPAISIPYLAVFTPKRSWVTYEDSSTLMACGSGLFDGGGFEIWSLKD